MKLYEVIQNEARLVDGGQGTRSILASRFSGENFADNSQLIVSDAEEAVFFRDGNLVATFSGGRYTLNTNNHPFLSRLMSKFTGGRPTFVASVYFISLDHKMELKWGTPSPMVIRDPKLGLRMEVQARGAYTVRILDSEKFILKFLGTNQALLTEDDLRTDFKSAFLEGITDAIITRLQESEDELLALLGKKRSIAESVVPQFSTYLQEYGLGLANFHIEAIQPVDNEHLQKYEAALAGGLATRLTGAADADVFRMTSSAMNEMGSNWERLQQARALEKLAENEGAGGLASAGMGIMAGGAFGQMAQAGLQRPEPAERPEPSPSASSSEQRRVFCLECGTQAGLSAKFCTDCGSRLEAAAALCSECSTQLLPGTKFCGQCGTQGPEFKA